MRASFPRIEVALFAFNPKQSSREILNSEVSMPAYLLLLAALLSRVIPHSGWFGFTAVGGLAALFWRSPRATPLARNAAPGRCSGCG